MSLRTHRPLSKQSIAVSRGFLAYQCSYPNATEKQMRRVVDLLREGSPFRVTLNGDCVKTKAKESQP